MSKASVLQWVAAVAMAMTSLLLAAAEPATPPPAATQPASLAGPFQWTSSGVLIKPVSDGAHKLVSVKDPTVVYYGDTRIEDFPKGMSNPEIALQETRETLFEGSMTYKIKGTGTYLTLIEALSPSRYYRAFTSDRLDGQWTPLPDADTYQKPFAGINNVTFEEGISAWTKDISHGELIRDGYDETMTIDASSLQMLHQGRDPSIRANYSLLPYQLGLLQLIQAGN